MRKEDLKTWIEHPEEIDEKATSELERAVQEYPYSAILQQLYLKGLQNSESYLSTSQLKKTSLWVSDRKALKDWLQGEDSGDQLEVPLNNPPHAKTEASAEVAADKPIAQPQRTSEPPVVQQKPEPAKPIPVKPTQQTPLTTSSDDVERPAPAPQPILKPSVPATSKPIEGKQTVLGDDLSHLPEKVRAIIEKSRRVHQQYGNVAEGENAKTKDAEPPQPSQPVPTSEKVEEPEHTPVEEFNEDVIPEQGETEVDEVELEWEGAEVELEDFPEEYDTELSVELSAESEEPELDAEPNEVEAIQETEPAKEVEPEPEERSFSRPIVLDELTSTGVDDDADFELDFTAWLRQKERHAKHLDEQLSEIEDTSAEVAVSFESSSIHFEVAEEQKEQAEKEATEQKQRNTDRELKMDLIDKFIQDQPKIKPVKKTITDIPTRGSASTIDVSAMGSEVGDDFITETLAQVYVQQGYLDKALSAYEILSLKYPEKSSFFADQISEIRRKKRNS